MEDEFPDEAPPPPSGFESGNSSESSSRRGSFEAGKHSRVSFKLGRRSVERRRSSRKMDGSQSDSSSPPSVRNSLDSDAPPPPPVGEMDVNNPLTEFGAANTDEALLAIEISGAGSAVVDGVYMRGAIEGGAATFVNEAGYKLSLQRAGDGMKWVIADDFVTYYEKGGKDQLWCRRWPPTFWFPAQR